MAQSAQLLPHRILVTGSTGLVGNALVPLLLDAGCQVRAIARSDASAAWTGHPACTFTRHDILSDDPAHLVDGIDAIVHLAARVHIMRDRAADPLQENRRLNRDATLALARAAAAGSVRQFVFTSTVKVNGESTTLQPFTEADNPDPQDAYAISKWEAETNLAELASNSAMGVTIIRPPLVYGPGVKGNFASLMRAVARGLPLPLGLIQNQRSLLYAGNLADAIVAALGQPAAGARTFLLSDGHDLSTPALVRAMATAMGRPARLLPVPLALLRLAGTLTGRSATIARLMGSLAIDSSRIRGELGWKPRFTLEEGLSATVNKPR